MQDLKCGHGTVAMPDLKCHASTAKPGTCLYTGACKHAHNTKQSDKRHSSMRVGLRIFAALQTHALNAQISCQKLRDFALTNLDDLTDALKACCE